MVSVNRRWDELGLCHVWRDHQWQHARLVELTAAAPCALCGNVISEGGHAIRGQTRTGDVHLHCVACIPAHAPGSEASTCRLCEKKALMELGFTARWVGLHPNYQRPRRARG